MYCCKNKKNISQKELRTIIFYNFRDLYKGVPGIPLYKKRKDCSETEIDQYYDILKNTLPNIHHSFCFNVDEIGFQEFPDEMEITVLFRANTQSQHVAIQLTEIENVII